jgi:3-phosphoshikimate 1-carboxyvinyltransferase
MKKSIQIAKEPICACLTIPGSKSITNRALLLAALADGRSTLTDILISDDTIALIKALQALGIDIQLNEKSHTCIVKGCNGQFPRKEAAIWCKDAGTVARFLLAVCAASVGAYHFDGSEQLRRRPLHQLIKILCLQGATITPMGAVQMPFSISNKGKLQGGEILVDASETGQFVSALLMASPLAQTSFLIKVKNRVSQPYINMTIAMMAEFGVLVRQLNSDSFSISVPQQYVGCDYVIEPDFSTASYFFAAAAITHGHVTIQPVNLETSKQGDVAFLTVLEKMGCEIISTQRGLTVKGPATLQGIHVDMRDFSDTMMTLAAIAPFASSPTTMTNIRHARNKESNRLSVVRQELEKLNIKVEEGQDWLRVYPGSPVANTINSHGDHRIAMAFSIIGLRVPGIQIDGAESVNKTCPEFFNLWDRLCY